MQLHTLSRFADGASSLGDTVPDMHKLDWQKALLTRWPDDRHFVCYGLGAMSIPRCTKSMTDTPGLLGNFIALDYDRTDSEGKKDPWKEGQAQEWLGNLDQLLTGIYSQWAAVYTTKNGARLLYRLSEGLSLRQHEAATRWFAVNCPIDVDKNTLDWTRVFRLYDVVRKGKQTTDQHYADIRIEADRTLDISKLDLAEFIDYKKSAAVFRSPKPTPEQCEDIVFQKDSDEPSEFFRTALELLRAYKLEDTDELYLLVSENKQPNLVQGERNTGIHRIAGRLARILRKVPDIGPEHIYALLVESILKIHGSEDWTNQLWRSCESIWATEEDERDEVASNAVFERALFGDSVAIEDQQEDEAEGFIKTVRSWSGFTGTDEELIEWVRRRAILMKKNEMFVILWSGYYGQFTVSRGGLLAHISYNNLEDIIPTYYEDEEGKTKPRAVTSIINEQAVNVGKVIGRAGLDGAIIDDAMGGLERADVVLPMARLRKDVRPKFHKSIDTWLRLLVGDYYEYLNHWIAKALDIAAGPVPVLYLQGPTSAGKSMIPVGIASCFVGKPPAVSDAELTGGYQDNMAESGIIHVDENWNVPVRGAHPADAIRRMIGGSSAISINNKWGVKFNGYCNYRVVMTDNDGGLMGGLGNAQGMKKQSREALLRRISHIEVNQKAANYLAKNGGYEMTEDWERNGDKLAEHFLYLHDKYAQEDLPQIEGVKEDDGRLLLPAIESEALANSLLDTTELTMIGEIICESLSRAQNPGRGYALIDGEVYVTTGPILEELKERNSSIKTQRQIAAILEEVHGKQGYVRKKIKGNRKRWHHIDRAFIERTLKHMDVVIEGIDHDTDTD